VKSGPVKAVQSLWTTDDMFSYAVEPLDARLQ